LHRGLRVTHHASHGLLLSPPAKRTDHLLFQADISCATNIDKPHVLTEAVLTATMHPARVQASSGGLQPEVAVSVRCLLLIAEICPSLVSALAIPIHQKRSATTCPSEIDFCSWRWLY